MQICSLYRRIFSEYTPPKFNIDPEQMVGLEDDPFLLEKVTFQGKTSFSTSGG